MQLSDLPHPAVIAHRGASAHAPENTLAAFKLALHQEADAIELDAKLTLDEHVVVIHDQTVDRTTPNSGRVQKLTLSEIRKMDAGSHFDISFAGEPVPTLDEVLKAVGQLTYINIELTNYASPLDRLPEKVAQIVRSHKLNQRVFFSSFNPVALMRIHQLMPEAPCGLLAIQGWKGSLARSLLRRISYFKSLHPEVSDVTADLVNKSHQRDQRVFVYTVNHEETMRHLFELGVDGIFTDNPILARQVLKRVDVTSTPR